VIGYIEDHDEGGAIEVGDKGVAHMLRALPELLDEVAALRAELDQLDRIATENMDALDVNSAEVRRLQAEVERMRPVVEAAVAHAEGCYDDPGFYHDFVMPLFDACQTYMEATNAAG
jgi:hypothetical protein